MATGKKVVKKRKVIIEAYGQAHIKASFNNIIISLHLDRQNSNNIFISHN